MKFVIQKGTPTFIEFQKLFERIDECRAAARELGLSLGFDSYYTYRSFLGTGIESFRSKSKPDGYKERRGGGYFPKAVKANKELIDRIQALPKVKEEELNALINFPDFSVFGNMRVCTGPGVEIGQEFVLISAPDEIEWQPPADVVELRMSEYHTLKAQIEKEKEAAKESRNVTTTTATGSADGK